MAESSPIQTKAEAHCAHGFRMDERCTEFPCGRKGDEIAVSSPIFTPEDVERFGLTFCEVCQDYIGGSHYHCSNCGESSGMMGHIWKDGWSCEYKKWVRPKSWEIDLEALHEEHERSELKRLKEKYPDG